MSNQWSPIYEKDQVSQELVSRYVSMTERLSSNTFFIDNKPHIVIDQDVCSGCERKTCITACPAELFVELHDSSIGFNYEYCLECGTCLILCSGDGALSWSYPKDGRGVSYLYG